MQTESESAIDQEIDIFVLLVLFQDFKVYCKTYDKCSSTLSPSQAFSTRLESAVHSIASIACMFSFSWYGLRTAVRHVLSLSEMALVFLSLYHKLCSLHCTGQQFSNWKLFRFFAVLSPNCLTWISNVGPCKLNLALHLFSCPPLLLVLCCWPYFRFNFILSFASLIAHVLPTWLLFAV